MEKRTHFRNNRLAYLLIAPQLFLVFLFFYWPGASAVYWAFTLERPFGGGNEFVGWDNFKAVFADSHYWGSIGSTVIFTVSATVLAMGSALILALFVDRRLKGSRLYQSIFVWPYVIAAPASAVAFRFIMAPQAGLLGFLNQAVPGLWDPGLNGTHAMIEIIVAYAWKWVGYNFLFLLAGLQSVPRGMIEAAALDGAGVLRRMRDIQLPMLTPTLFFLLVLNITESFQDSFGIIDVMTEGGPAKSTDLLVYKLYFDGFKGFDYSGAAAQSVILMLLVMLFTMIQFRFVERRVHYK